MNADYKHNYINYFTGEHKSDEFKKINPHATVPAATDGNLSLTESNAILQYAADVSGNESMYPKDLKQRADINRWLLWEASNWFPCCYVFLVENVVKPLLKAEPDQKALDAESERFHRGAGILDERLSKNKWLTGDNVTIADFAVAAPMHLHAAQKLPLEQYPNLKRWLTEGMEQLESWKKTQGAVTTALCPGETAAQNGQPGAGQPDVRTTVNYTKAVDQPTEIYLYESDKAKGIHEPGDAPVEISVSDGWPHAREFSIDKNGFSVHDFHTAYNDWEEDQAVRTEFYPEVVEFLKRTTGAKRVLVFDHTIRTEKNSKKALTDEKNTSQRSPVMLVHCDYTAESGPLRVRQLLGDEADELLSRRVAFINVWKPINRVVEERPLAMCDVTSCKDEDFFKLYLHYRDRDGENYVMKHSARHKWWYFPKMTPEQAILLKTFDSAADGRARFVGHTAFVDPTSPPDAPLRESVEIRTICFY
jgi:glutathione S-transferase